MKQLSLRTGLLALLAFMTLLLLAVSFMGIVAINKGNRSLDVINRIQGIELNSLYQSNADLMRARANAALAVRKIEIGMLEEGAAVTRLSQADVVSSQQNLKRFMDAGTVTAHGKMLADAIAASYKAYLDQGIKPMMTALDKQYTDEYYQLLEGNLATLAAGYNKAVTDFSQFAEQVTQAQLAQAAHNETKMKILIAVAVILTLMLLVLAWQLLRRMLLLPLNQAIVHLEQISMGDLSQALPPSSNNELGRLNHALADMQASLRTSVSQVREASMQIDIGSRELAAGNVNLSQRTEESAASLEQTAASMEQLTATVKQNAENARQASKLALSASETAEKGGSVVDSVVKTMRDIAGSSKKIADITSVIDGIAFQTNILALNAAVEAARAGEQGRGFAVVAGEVRNLAQRSAQAAKEIKGLIDDSVNRVNVGSQLVGTAGETMGDIVNAVTRVTDIMGEIATASDEQSRGIEQVGLAVNEMDRVTQQNAALVEESATAAASLEDQASRLSQSVALFKIKRDDGQPSLTRHLPIAGPETAALTSRNAVTAPVSDTHWETF